MAEGRRKLEVGDFELYNSYRILLSSHLSTKTARTNEEHEPGENRTRHPPYKRLIIYRLQHFFFTFQRHQV
jgi:hypothetical protein